LARETCETSGKGATGERGCGIREAREKQDGCGAVGMFND